MRGLQKRRVEQQRRNREREREMGKNEQRWENKLMPLTADTSFHSPIQLRISRIKE